MSVPKKDKHTVWIPSDQLLKDLRSLKQYERETDADVIRRLVAKEMKTK